MNALLTYRGRSVTAADVAFVRDLIVAHPALSRRALSLKVCHPVYFLETFVDPARHRGTCYLAANWIVLGKTVGRGHRCPTMQPNRPPKLVLGYPLVKRFREVLGEVSRSPEDQN